jgi:uncharacterized membrane protein YdbT with pleckstrin-like domain
VAAAVAAGLGVAFGTPALPALLLLPLAAAAGLLRFRTAGWRFDGERVVLRTRGLARTTAAIDARRLQSVRCSATPFQRRGRLATLAVDVSSGRRLGIAHLDATVADDLLGALGRTATGPG